MRTRLGAIRRLDEIDDHYGAGIIGDYPGVYVFYQQQYEGRPPLPRYVGRSGSSVYRRIRGRFRTHRDGGYTYYSFKPCNGDYAAYKWECRYYHRHKRRQDGGTLDNINHPAMPSDSSVNHYCPICGE